MKSIPTFEAIRNRRSVRNFSTKKIDDRILYEILELSNRAPSGYNLQPWHFVLVKDKQVKELLQHIALSQRQIIEAPYIVVFVADPKAWSKDYLRVLTESVEANLMSESYADFSKKNVDTNFRLGLFGVVGLYKKITQPIKRLARPTSNSITSKHELENYVEKQTIFSAATFMIAAAGAGLATCPMEGYDEGRLKKLLAIPRRMKVPLIVATGYPIEDPAEDVESFRLPLKEKLSVDIFSAKLFKYKPDI